MSEERAAQSEEYLSGKRVCATGRLATMTHRELSELVKSSGGDYVDFPRRGKLLLVVGDNGWGRSSDAAVLPSEEGSTDSSPTKVLQRAQELLALGYPISIVSEQEFLDHLDPHAFANPFRKLHTVADVSRILNVAPTVVRRWVRIGLIEPSSTLCRLHYFDFEQVAFARRIWEALEAGIRLDDIRQQIEQLRKLWPESIVDLTRLAELRHHRIVMRTDDGLLDQRGQRFFDFDEPDMPPTNLRFTPLEPESVTVEVATDNRIDQRVDQLVDKALDLEEAGLYDHACDTYQAALELSPEDPVLLFNLGNAHYALEEYEQARASYERAVARDTNYAEAWNNLGHLQSDLGENTDAVRSFKKALALVPDFDLAQENLDDVVRRMIVD